MSIPCPEVAFVVVKADRWMPSMAARALAIVQAGQAWYPAPENFDLGGASWFELLIRSSGGNEIIGHSNAPLPPGRYRALFLLLPTEEKNM